MAGGAGKKTTAKRKAEPKKRTVSPGRELLGLGLVALGIFGTFSVLQKSTGILGGELRNALFGAFGVLAYPVPAVLAAFGLVLMLARRKKSSPLHRIALWTLLWLLVILVVHLPAYGEIDHATLEQGIVDAWAYATHDNSLNPVRSGGALGALVAFPMVSLFGETGAWLAGIVGIMACLLAITRISIKDLGLKAYKKASDTVVRGQERYRASRERLSRERMRREDEVAEQPRGILTPLPENIDGIADMADYGLSRRKAPADRPAPRTAGLADIAAADVSAAAVPSSSASSGGAEEAEEEGGAPPQPEISIVEAPPPEPSRPGKETLREAVVPIAGTPDPYHFPPLSLLQEPERGRESRTVRSELEQNIAKLEETLRSFGVEAAVTGVTRGPAITRYELSPAPGVRVSRIAGLADDLALNLAALGVRIEAPIPGKAAVGIEVPNASVATVSIREVLESGEFSKDASKIAAALGKDISGKSIVADLARMPHLLIAGATGSGKSVCINTLIASILYKATPEEVRMIMIDPKVVELSVFNGIPHLLIPVVTDPKKAAAALQWAVQEMTERYHKFAAFGVRDIRGFNEYAREAAVKAEEAAAPPEIMPQIVIIIDELADLMILVGKEVEDAICRLAQLARAAGIHLVIATQRPSVNVITGVIKANIPSRIAFAVASQVDSRTILDMAGAEKLLGRGDMLYYPSGENRPRRVQGAFISDKEVTALVACVKGAGGAEYDIDAIERIESMQTAEKPKSADADANEKVDELLAEAIEYAVAEGQIAVSTIQRHFQVGYARAGRLIDAMEQRGVIEGFTGSKPRKVLITREELSRMGPS